MGTEIEATAECAAREYPVEDWQSIARQTEFHLVRTGSAKEA